VQDPTVDGEWTPLAPAPAEQAELTPDRDPVSLAAADVQAILAGAAGLRRVVELAAETALPEE
jgi:hypothetical protein